jgi:uncharacterized protein
MLADEQLPRVWRELGIPGVVDAHVHFMPDRLQQRVWAYFDRGGPLLGRPIPVTYRLSEQQRIDRLRQMGVRAWTALVYPHKAGMAATLNDWGVGFAARVPEAIQTATFFPEPGVADYMADAVTAGARAVKAHVAVGRYDPRDPLLRPVWGLLEDAALPVIIHASSSPASPYTGPGPVAEVLARFPRLRLVFAHAGSPEFGGFAELCRRFAECRLDLSMVFDDFTSSPGGLGRELRGLSGQVLWGSDYPSIPHPVSHQVTRLLDSGFDSGWLAQVFWHNGKELFGLGGAW